MNKIYDVSGEELNVGDRVSFCRPGLKRLLVGRVKNLTPSGVTIQYYHPDDKRRELLRTVSRLSNQVAKAVSQND